MPLTKIQKNELIDDYEQGLAGAAHAFVLDFKGISVPQATELRLRIRNSGGQYRVVKNTLALRAIQGKPLDGCKEVFQGPTAVAFSSGDAVQLAKTLTEFAKTAPVLKFKAGLVEGQVVPVDQIDQIAQLPSREELIAKLLYLLQSPLTRLVRDLNAIQQQFVVVLDQIAKQKEA